MKMTETDEQIITDNKTRSLRCAENLLACSCNKDSAYS
jgi:hypothetical protein